MFSKKASGGAEKPILKPDGSIEVRPLKHEKIKKGESTLIDDLSVPLDLQSAVKKRFNTGYVIAAVLLLIMIFIVAFYLIYTYGDISKFPSPKYEEQTREVITKEKITERVPKPILFSESLKDINSLINKDIEIKGYLLNRYEDYVSKNFIVDDEGNEVLVRLNRELYENPNVAKYFIEEGQTEDVFLIKGRIRKDFNTLVLLASDIEKTEKDYILVEKEVFTKKNTTLMVEQ